MPNNTKDLNVPRKIEQARIAIKVTPSLFNNQGTCNASITKKFKTRNMQVSHYFMFPPMKYVFISKYLFRYFKPFMSCTFIVLKAI